MRMLSRARDRHKKIRQSGRTELAASFKSSLDRPHAGLNVRAEFVKAEGAGISRAAEDIGETVFALFYLGCRFDSKGANTLRSGELRDRPGRPPLF
jgi:hypothetical protein